MGNLNGSETKCWSFVFWVFPPNCDAWKSSVWAVKSKASAGGLLCLTHLMDLTVARYQASAEPDQVREGNMKGGMWSWSRWRKTSKRLKLGCWPLKWCYIKLQWEKKTVIVRESDRSISSTLRATRPEYRQQDGVWHRQMEAENTQRCYRNSRISLSLPMINKVSTLNPLQSRVRWW